MNCRWLEIGVLFLLNNVLRSDQAGRDASDAVLTHKWIHAEFNYANERAKYDALKQGHLIPKNLIVFDADYHPHTNRYFVTTPPFRNGTPSSLAEVVRGQNVLKPFPTWSNGNNTDKNGCQKGPPLSVYRIHIDKCGLLWVPDTGIYEVLAATQLTCPAALWVYDLNRGDRLMLRYEFPQNVITSRSLPVNVITESYRSDCSDSIAYIADVMDHGLIVFDYAKKSSWRVEHKYFYMFPTAPTMHSNGVSLDLNDGLCGLALSPASDQDRKLYFHSLASVHESWVPVCVLKNGTLAKDPFVARANFHLSPGQREGHSTVEVMTDDGILIYPVVTSNSLYCWNSRTQYTSENQHLLKKDDENFQFISGLKLSGNKLIIMASRFQNYLLANLSETDYNYRLLVIDDVRRFIQNSPCSSKSYANTNGDVSSSSSVCADLHSSSNVYTPSSGNHWASYYGSSANNQKSSMTNNKPTAVRTTTAPQARAPYTSSVHTTSSPSAKDVIFKPHHNTRPNTYYNKDGNLDFTQNRLGESDDTLMGPATINKTIVPEGPNQVTQTQTSVRNSRPI